MNTAGRETKTFGPIPEIFVGVRFEVSGNEATGARLSQPQRVAWRLLHEPSWSVSWRSAAGGTPALLTDILNLTLFVVGAPQLLAIRRIEQ
jgi:hypothetical protein